MSVDTTIVSQCLHCKNARCQAACPIHTNIPTVSEWVQQGKESQA